MTPFEELMPTVNAGVDSNLGDTLTYETAVGVPLVPPDGYAAIFAFVKNDADTNALDGIMPMRSRWSLKIAKALLPDGPKQAHRLTCARLGGIWYTPGPGVPDDQGDYWYCELQKD